MTNPVSSPNFTTLHTYETCHSADSVEWCPHEPNHNVFVCANYQLIGKHFNTDLNLLSLTNILTSYRSISKH